MPLENSAAGYSKLAKGLGVSGKKVKDGAQLDHSQYPYFSSEAATSNETGTIVLVPSALKHSGI